ncbi:MAG: amidohydrolase family protein [Myxococcota bacterium]
MPPETFLRRALAPITGLLLLTGCPDPDPVPVDEGTGTTAGSGTDPMGSATDGSTSLDTTVDTTVDTTATDGETESETESDTDPPPPPGRHIVCDEEVAKAPEGEVCAVTPGSASLLLQGTVLAGFDVYENGSVLVDTTDPNGRITCVGCDCAATDEGRVATVVACDQGVISPGLINPHDHITFTLSQPQGHADERYDHRHDWRLGLDGHTELNTFPGSDSSREGVLYGELRMLLGGATSLTGSVGGANASGLVRNLDRADVTEGLEGVDVNYRTFPLGDAGGDLIAMGCDYPFIDGDFNLNDDVYMPHVAEGINDEARNEFACLSGAPGGTDLIAGNTSVIHGIGMRPTDINVMAQEGAMLVWSPRSNIDLYGISADITAYRNLGVRIALGTDWTASGSMNVLRELACAAEFNANHLDNAFSDAELWLMTTYWAAVSQGADDQIGLLREGHIADIAIFDGSENTDHRAIIDGHPSDVALVLRGGQPLHGDASVIEALIDPAEVEQCETLDVCGVDKRMCSERDAGLQIGQIQAEVNAAAYPLFFCDTPDDEPSCDPARPDEFPQRGGPDDADGDGVADADDNCPSVFNPIRPLDGDIQGDNDADGLGDVCDLCPLDPGEDCEVPDIFDQDGDGVEDPADNCLLDENADQNDADEDGQGDACDACPMVPNPGGGACPVSLYEIKDGTIMPGQAVIVEDVLVTASSLDAPGYFVQVHPDDPGYMGVDFSGMYIYTAGAFVPNVGDRLTVSGTVNDFFGQIQLDAAGEPAPTLLSMGNELPVPEVTTPADIIEMGPLQAELEGVLVVVNGATVTDTNPAPGPGDDGTNEFEVMGGLRVNDLFYAADPFPMNGQTYSQIIGIARWANQYTKLEPRSIADYPASLVGFGQPESYLLQGIMAEPTPGLAAELSAPAQGDVMVNLTYADPGIVTGPAFVTIADGTLSTPVVLTGVAVGTADVTAELNGVQLVTSVVVYDDADTRFPSIDPTAINMQLMEMANLTVQLNLPAPVGGQLVDLAVAPGTCVTVPPNVTVPAGALSAPFTVTSLACTGDEVVIASIGAESGDATVSVIDAPAFTDLIIVEAYYDHPGGDDGFEWVKLYNGTGAAVDLTGHSLGWGGTDYTYGGIDLVGVIPDGACFVVGGPSGNADNGFPAGPAYDQAEDLDQDMQNSGATADGIALFSVPVASVGAGTVPIDAVIYGDANDSGLIDETGGVAPVNVGDVASGSSIRMQADLTWLAEPSPAPLECVPFPGT